MYYNYVYLDPRKKGIYNYENICFLYEPFYVGKGKKERCYYHLNNKRIDNNILKNKIDLLKNIYNLKDFIIKFNFTDDESNAYLNEINLIKEIGSNHIKDIKNGSLVNICLDNQPPSLKGKSYKDIYGDRWQSEIDKRRNIQIEKGGFFSGKSHTEESKEKISRSIMGEKNPMWNKKHSLETRKKLGNKNNKGSFNSNKKVFLVINPDGEIFYADGNIKEFCINNNLSYSALQKTLKTKKPPNRGKTKGWLLKYTN